MENRSADTDDRLRRPLRRHRRPPYDPRAYLLVGEVLQLLGSRLSERRHLSARECADGVLELAAARFGVLGDAILECWGIHASEDIGAIVAALVDHGVVAMGREDRIEDFGGLFRVEEDYAARYRIGEGLRSRSAGRPRGYR